MAEAVVRLALDPSGMTAGARVAQTSLRSISTATSRMAQSATQDLQRVTAGVRRTGAAVDGLTARFRVMGRTAQAVGAGAGQALGSTFAAGIRRSSGQAVSAASGMASRVQSQLRGIGGGPGQLPGGIAPPRTPVILDQHGRPMSTGRPPGVTASQPVPRPISAGLSSGAGAAPPAPAPPPTQEGPARRWGTHGTPRNAQEMATFTAQNRASRGAEASWRQRRRDTERPTAPAGRRGQPDPWGSDGIGRLWALSALGGQIRSVVQRGVQRGEENIGVARELQTARAEARTVVEGEADRALVREAARESALGRGPAVVPITETDFTNAVFRGVASGLTTQRAVNLVPVSSNLALAGQTTAEVASVGLTDTGNVFRDRSFAELGDIYARAQDIGTFPRGIQELFTATTKAASTAKAAGVSFEETVATVTTLSSMGPTFRGATGGQKALMAIRELDLGGLQKLGISAVRDEGGGLDLPATLQMISDLELTGAQIVAAVGKRAAPALIALADNVDKFRSTLGELDSATGTAAANAAEHADTLASREQRRTARREVFQSGAGEGAAAAREVGLRVHDAIMSAAVAVPGLAQAAGFAMEAGSRVGQVAGVALDTAVGVHAFKQLAGGTLNPLNLFRRGDAAEDGRAGRRAGRAEARGQRARVRALDGQARQWRGTFGAISRGIGRTRSGFAGMFRVVGSTLATLAADFAGSAVGGAAAGATTTAGKTAATAGTAAVVTKAAAVGSAALAAAPVVLGTAGAGLIVAQIVEGAQEAEAARARRGERAGGLTRAVAEGGRVAQNVLGWLGIGKGAAPPPDASGAVDRTVATGAAQGQGALVQQTEQTAQQVRDRMPSSDAKVGPLSDLTAAGAAIPMTLAEGVMLGAPTLTAAVAEMFAAAGLPEPVTVAAPEALTPEPVALGPVGPLATLAPEPVAIPDPAIAPPTLAPPPAAVTLTDPDAATAPATVPPAAAAAPATLAPDAIAAPPLLAPEPLAADPPAFGPPALLDTSTILFAPAPLTALDGAPEGEVGAVPPDASAGILGTLAGDSDGSAAVALAALLNSNRELVAVNLRVLEEMRRKRRDGDRRGQSGADHQWPADVIDYDTAGEILAGLL